MSKPFNVRGGGLEFGEGTRECLVREFKEELNLEVEIGEHFYTQDFFIQNAFDPSEQILMIYYLAKTTNEALEKLQIIDQDIKEVLWLNPAELEAKQMTLATDKIVIELYKKKNFES